jgi:CRP-like cAMP-binding protein
LEAADFAMLAPHLEAVELPLRQTLIHANKSIDSVYFLEQGLASIVNDSADGNIELGVVGCEGFVGLPVLLGTDRTPHEVFMQIEGHGLCIEAQKFIELVEKRSAMRRVFLRFAHAMNIQTAQTAFANANNSVESRLARWLLMCHDRVKGNDIPLTHEFMAMMLGVRRAGVTVTLHILEGNKLIRAKRGVVTVLDRPRLIELADDGYGQAEAEYARVMAEGDAGLKDDYDDREVPHRTSQANR